MNTIPAIDEQEIEEFVGERSFHLGQQYASSGAIFEQRRQGTTLRARCEGSSGGPYRVQATFDDEGLAHATCSCPVGAEGDCKHVAALLLTWLEHPDSFTELQDPAVALERRTKAQLITLIQQMLRQAPELEMLLDIPLPGTGEPPHPPDPELYRRQAEALFRGSRHEWGEEVDLSERLLAVIAIGEGFIDQQDFTAAAAVFEGVVSTMLEQYMGYSDEGWELASVIMACVEGLGHCLAGARDPSTRQGIIHTLFAIYQFDIRQGGIGIAEEVPEQLVTHTTAEERHALADMVRAAQPAGAGWMQSHIRRAYGGFLLALEADTLDDESYLRICRETGRLHDLVERLLSLQRVDEALGDARSAGDVDLLTVANLFLAHGYAASIQPLIVERATGTNDMRLLEWLVDYYKTQGDKGAALEWAEQLFRRHPTPERYKDIRELAGSLGRWNTVRPTLLEFLERSQNTYTLIMVYLDEGEIDAALAVLSSTPVFDDLRLRVATAAEESRPERALEIYKSSAEHLIEQQGRGNYREAARLLTRAQVLYDKLGNIDGWHSYMAELRERHRRFRALKEELAAAGL